MRSIGTRSAIIVATAALVVGCSTRPDSEIDAANAAMDRARNANAASLAAESMQSAELAQAALETEMTIQDDKWFKSYDKARELADAMRLAADKATAEAASARAEAERAAAEKADRSRRTATTRTESVATAGSQPVKILDVRPVYPAIARTAGVTGTVVIQATIDRDGKVARTEVVHSVPLLDQAALDAVRQWEYKPSMKGGKPVPAVVTVNVNFVRS